MQKIIINTSYEFLSVACAVIEELFGWDSPLYFVLFHTSANLETVRKTIFVTDNIYLKVKNNFNFKKMKEEAHRMLAELRSYPLTAKRHLLLNICVAIRQSEYNESLDSIYINLQPLNDLVEKVNNEETNNE
ncbi:MAG: hypothetical protein RBT34_00150 [Anaerolineaceae bacterium]|nr:hypothetical protein [Anaerolineaceae bacterium]